MVDEPIVSSEVDPPDTIPVTIASVEMATGPPAPPVAPEAPGLCIVLVPFSFVQSSRRLTDPVAVAFVPPVPVVDVTVTVPVGDVTVTIVVVLAPEAPEAPAARAATHRLAKALITLVIAEDLDERVDIRTGTVR
jgi:hypothetical protein